MRDEVADWVGLGDASRLLGISQTTLRRWADEGLVPVFTTPGGHRRFSRGALRSLVGPVAPRRTSLARLGLSPDRVATTYRRSARLRRPPRTDATPAAWHDRLSEEERLVFRERGRRLVALLLAHLDAADGDVSQRRLQEAAQLAAEQGRNLARLGASLSDAVGSFLEFRAPFMAHIAGVVGRRAVDRRRAADLLVAAERAVDHLLIATMTGHSLEARQSDARPDARGAARPSAR